MTLVFTTYTAARPPDREFEALSIIPSRSALLDNGCSRLIEQAVRRAEALQGQSVAQNVVQLPFNKMSHDTRLYLRTRSDC